MYSDYIHTLINDLPVDNLNNKKGTIKTIDLILDGGAFNGSYMIGCLLFLKEMESKNLIKVENISGCSVGALCALLYSCNCLDLFNTLYSKLAESFKKHKQISGVYDLLHDLRENLPKDFHKKLHNPLSICYYDVIKREKIVKHDFTNEDELIETIRRSCHVPFIIEGYALHMDTYMDGFTPYLFKKEDHKERLFIHLSNLNKVFNIISIKNENSNVNRVLTGILDIHSFFVKNSDTELCSYLYDNSSFQNMYFFMRYIMEQIIMIIMFMYIVYCKSYITNITSSNNIFIIELLKHLYSQTCGFIINYYCI